MENEYSFMKILSIDTLKKSVTILYAKSNQIPPATIFEFLEFCKELHTLNPNMFKIEILQKANFPIESPSEIALKMKKTAVIEATDIYMKSWYEGIEANINSILVDKIEPCTIAHIKKYLQHRHKLISETPKLYQDIVLPYINSIPKEHLNWVRKVCEGGEELLYHDPDPHTGFLIGFDFKWDRKDLNSLYLLVIVMDGNLKSIRDLTGYDEIFKLETI